MVSQQYLAILLLFIISSLFAILPLISNFVISRLINNNKPTKIINDFSKNAQLSSYECGVSTLSDARFKFPIKFALISILFIIFDVEVIFLFPWALVFSKLTGAAKVAMGVFLLVLVIGFIYEWKKGALVWEYQ